MMHTDKNTKRKYEEMNIPEIINNSNISMNGAEESEDFYEVEEIVGKKTNKGKTLYQVKWVGYSSDQNTWEPLENLENVLNLVEEFENLNESMKRKKKSKKQPESNEDQIEKIIEKYKDYGLRDLIKNNNKKSKNRSRDMTRSTDENEDKSLSKSLNTSSANDGVRTDPELDGIVNNVKKSEWMADICKDKPAFIKCAKVVNKELRFLVKWEKRQNEFEPLSSWVKHEAIKKLYPYVLIDFYESRLKNIAQIDEESKKKDEINSI